MHIGRYDAVPGIYQLCSRRTGESGKGGNDRGVGRRSRGQIFISTLPRISYTSLIQPVPVPADSNPRITWGKYFVQEERVLLEEEFDRLGH